MRRPGLHRKVGGLLRERREPAYPVEGWTPGTEPMVAPHHEGRPTGPPPKPEDAHRLTGVATRRRHRLETHVHTDLSGLTDRDLIRLAENVGEELQRRRRSGL